LKLYLNEHSSQLSFYSVVKQSFLCFFSQLRASQLVG
jgi:hypothetical protein